MEDTLREGRHPVVTYRKKLIEVALPLEAINRESAREKSIRHGHPSTLHLWWARRPLAACRAVLFASIVDDPSSRPEEFPTEEAQTAERERLFRIIEDLVKWENSHNERVLDAARQEILKATDGNPPPMLDPFCGGGSIPLEGQRLGLEAHASDLNPIAVLITKALIEIPPKFDGQPPVNPESRGGMAHTGTWKGAQGLAEDVRYYGKWMRDEAQRRIGHLYPKAKLPKEEGGGEATVLAWLWARTAKCPNPACAAMMPLISSFWLSKKPKKRTWIEPVVDRQANTVRFEIRKGEGEPPRPPKLGRGAKFQCLVCGQAADDQHIKDEGTAGRMSVQLMAIVAEGSGGRIYLPPEDDHAAIARSAAPPWAPEEELAYDPRAIWCTLYGLKHFRDLFTLRQLVAMTTFSDLVGQAREVVLRDSVHSGLMNDGVELAEAGTGATAYADAVATYLGFGVDRSADFWCTLATWSPQPKNEIVGHAFGRQALPMTWDFGEVNPFSRSGGNWEGNLSFVVKSLEGNVPAARAATVSQLDATVALERLHQPLVFTDPPYYDNIGYADLSDFFYVWLRRSLHGLYPNLFSTLLTPKARELVATPYRFGGSKAAAEKFFEEGLARAFQMMRDIQNPQFPLSVIYAFKQAESVGETGLGSPSVVVSTGWETMLEGMLGVGLAVTGTWPIRSERFQGLKSSVNALASSIVLVCRPRPLDARLATRREFVAALRAELPDALRNLQQGNIAPVDLAQASIGPGMAVFSRYARILEADGSPMRVRTALGLINQALDEVLTEQESEYDAPTRWAISWFEEHGLDEGSYGDAETLARARNVSVMGLVEEGFLWSRGGKVRLLPRQQLDPDWDPVVDRSLSVWEVSQHLVRALGTDGDVGAATLLRKLGALGEAARDVAYRLYSICERKNWAQEALAYNSLVVAWPEISRLAAEPIGEHQPTLGV